MDGRLDLGNSLLSLETPQLGDFEGVSKKALYLVAVKVHLQAALAGVRPLGWPVDLGPDSSLRRCWRSLYKPPLEKCTADPLWRIIHWAIATNTHMPHLDPTVVDSCLFCRECETFQHWFLEYARLGDILEIVRGLCTGLQNPFRWQLYIRGARYRLAKNNDLSVDFNF